MQAIAFLQFKTEAHADHFFGKFAFCRQFNRRTGYLLSFITIITPQNVRPLFIKERTVRHKSTEEWKG
jgi:hypothetical protein